MRRIWSSLGFAALVSAAAACSIITRVDDLEPTGSGGAGGAGGTGSAGGGGGAGGGEVLQAWAAEAPDAATGAYTLPGWLVLESPSEDKTVQTGPDRLRSGFGPNAARARSVDGVAWGLNVESERTNRVNTTRVAGPGWQVLSGTLTAADGADGETLAGTITDNSAAESTAAIEDFTPEAVGEAVTLSAWATTDSTQASLECNACAEPASLPIDPGLGWHRESLTTTEVAGSALVRLRPAAAAPSDLGSATFDLVSVETGRYPSSVIFTTGAPATRDAERLSVAAASDVAPGGWFHVVLVFAPNYASGEQGADHDLLFFDAQNRLFVRASDSAIVLQAEGTDMLEMPGLTWERNQELTVEVISTEAGRTLRVAGADGGEASANDTAAGAVPVEGPLHLLGDATGSQECADLRAITFHRPM